MKRKPKAKTYAQLKRELDRVFSIWVRKRDADENGNARCCTCRTLQPWPKLQAGHFVSRVHLSTRWEPMNVAAQCNFCNIHRRGNPAEFALFLQKRYGETIIERLVSAKRMSWKPSRADLQALIVRYSDPIPEASISDPEQSSG